MPAAASRAASGPLRVSVQTWTSNSSRGSPSASRHNCFSAPPRSRVGMICKIRFVMTATLETMLRACRPWWQGNARRLSAGRPGPAARRTPDPPASGRRPSPRRRERSGASSPFCSFSIYSRWPAMSDATTGNPAAKASHSATPLSGSDVGRRKTSAVASTASTSSNVPTTRT